MERKNILRLALLPALGFAGTGTGAHAAAIPQQHIKQHLRVDGSSDLRGAVRARNGINVTAGVTTDRLDASGAVKVGGTLTVAGLATLSGGLSAGQGAISTAGTLQGGTLNILGESSVAGDLTVAKTLSAGSASVGAGGLQIAGAASAASLTVQNATVSSGLKADSITGRAGTFTQLDMAGNGTVNFNNATVSGLNLSGGTKLSSLLISAAAPNGPGAGPQPFSITQSGQTASLSVASSGLLTVAGAGLATPALSVTNSATVGGTLSVSQVAAPSALVLSAPDVLTSKDLTLGAGGDLHLDANSSGPSHLIGNHDTRGQCSAFASVGSINTCTLAFTRAYAAAPVVVATPANADPAVVTGYSVQSTTSGLTISFRVSTPTTVTFNYMVQG